ncbi:hypothetical protein JRQ81_008009 [Phrynocephalus forsythii]|uniref:Uncharacterized protein n=1 Tax=Phrynocephalus forsythii TaxID=171643 RepID=A0A9Q0Y7C3_9SAUR|nr:hypothetical protein JRQ81_008009 [Phrynocephalus forsythii]
MPSRLSLIQRVIVKIRRDRANIILITPWWPRQAWFAHLLRLSTEHLRLPLFASLLSRDDGAILHPTSTISN